MRSTYWMENIGRPEDEWDFLLGKDNEHPSLKTYRRPKDKPHNPSEADLRVFEEAREAAQRLGRKSRTDRLQRNIIIKQQQRLKGNAK